VNIVSIEKGEALTTSLAIAVGVDNPHASVIKLIRQNVNDFEEFGLLDFKSESTEGRPTEYALLNEQQATLLMTYMRNSDVVKQFKKRLVKAFYELAKSKQVPQDLSRLEILQIAMAAEEEKIALKHEVEELKPKADFCDQVAIAEDAISLAKAAKVLDTGRNRLITYLKQISWLTRRGEPYQCKIESGYLDVKLGSWQHPDHGLQQSVTALVTGKGLVKLQQMRSEGSAA